MITEREINAVKLSPTKKDFYQIWNELLDTASKLSNRWDPTSTNEADPGIVLLKVLTAIADKLNYNVDKNILEAFMPSATQEESMRKLCDMLGYSMKYYRSATTSVTITYTGDKDLSKDGNRISIPKYAVITTADDDVTYCTLNNVLFNDVITTKQVEAIEGTVELCSTNEGSIITLANLDDNNRFYLPETQIAENGVFVNSVKYTGVGTELITSEEDQPWTKVTNLNTQNINEKIFKFSFDSQEQLPYIQFPDDIANIINDGVYIRYTRTNGVNGNIAVRTLSKFQTIDNIICNNEEINLEEELSVTNTARTTNGYNKESINDAYTNYKKTVGTFDTLVTCRDYMNKIYQLTHQDLSPDTSSNTTPLVSNIIVSDIRDDINKSFTLCTFDEFGINYVERSIKRGANDLIECFDLMLYPFATIAGSNSINEYINSFKYSDGNLSNIISLLDNNKTISHIFRTPEDNDIVCIKNYLRLNAKITTTSKVSIGEQTDILNKIYTSLYTNFNMRKLEFGEEIPFDSILEVISGADTKIKNVSLDEPQLYTVFCTKDGTDYDMTTTLGKQYYNHLALRNILAGKISMFNYDESFAPDYREKTNSNYPNPFPLDSAQSILRLESEYNPAATSNLSLNDNEVIQFRAPNFKTIIPYPAYVKYYIKLKPATKIIAKDTDYQLDQGEYLAICYTPASSDDSTTTEEVTKVYYQGCPEGNIIRPNFDLSDSDKFHENKSWSTGNKGPYSISVYGQTVSIGGYFGLDVEERIEIRKPAETILNNGMINIYWRRQDDLANATDNGLVEFIFTDDFTDDNYTSYTLKEGEYFYYTDKNKLDFLYYGNGTKITKSGDIKLVKNIKADNVSNEDILTYGLAATIPWINYTVNNTDYLTLKEYQYINLTSGDTLVATTGLDHAFDNTWRNISTFSYIYSSGEDGSKSSTNICQWQARSKLEFDFSPTQVQTLSQADVIKIYYDRNIPGRVNPQEITNVSIKGNYTILSSSDTVNVGTIEGFKIKPFNLEDNLGINLNNYGDNLTRIVFSDSTNLTPGHHNYTHLNISMPSSDSGLIMMYYIPYQGYQETIASCAYLELSNSVEPTIYNHIVDDVESWWGSEYIDNSKYYLRAGLNIIHVPASCIINIYSDTDNKDILLFSTLDLIPTDNELAINPKLSYKVINPETTHSALEQLLSDIKTFDTDDEFYYNVVPDNSNVIDLNPYNDEETLDSPYTWYSYNNINNKFVISEIDADYLTQGISIAYASKLK